MTGPRPGLGRGPRATWRRDFSKYHLANKDRSKARDERKIELLGLDYSGGSAGHEPRTTLQTARPKYVPHQSNQHPYANKFAHLKASLPTSIPSQYPDSPEMLVWPKRNGNEESTFVRPHPSIKSIKDKIPEFPTP